MSTVKYRRRDFIFKDVQVLSLNDRDLEHRKMFKQLMTLRTYEIRKWKLETFWVDLEYNDRYDVDNCILIIKHFVDSLKANGIIKDDNNGTFKKLMITYNNDIPRYSFVIRLYYTTKELKQTNKVNNGKKGTNNQSRRYRGV